MKTLGVTRTRVSSENPLLCHCRRSVSLLKLRSFFSCGPRIGVSVSHQDYAAPFCLGARFGQLLWPRGFLEFSVRTTQKNRKMNCILWISSGQGAGQKNTEKICFLTARSFSVGPLLLLHKITEFAFCAPSYHVCSLVEKTHFAPPAPLRLPPLFGQMRLFCNYSL